MRLCWEGIEQGDRQADLLVLPTDPKYVYYVK